MATHKQPPGGLSIDDAIAEELDDLESDANTPLGGPDSTQATKPRQRPEDDDFDMGSETLLVRLPANFLDAQAQAQTQTQQNARLQPLPRGVFAEIDFGNARYTLTKSLTIIGRVKEVADIAMPEDDQLSRHHAAVAYADGVFIVEDLESTNGTFIGGKPIKRATLAPGVEVSVGKQVFKLRVK